MSFSRWFNNYFYTYHKSNSKNNSKLIEQFFACAPNPDDTDGEYVEFTIPVILFDIFTLIILSFLFHYMIGIPFIYKVKKEIDLYDRN
jgi:hypothetical protein